MLESEEHLVEVDSKQAEACFPLVIPEHLAAGDSVSPR